MVGLAKVEPQDPNDGHGEVERRSEFAKFVSSDSLKKIKIK